MNISNQNRIAQDDARTMRQVKNTAIAINAVGLLLCYWVMFYPHPYTVATTLTAVFPLIMLFSILATNGIIQLTKGAKFNINLGTFAPIAGLGCRSLEDWSILSDFFVFLWGVIGMLLLAGVVFIFDRRVYNNLWHLIASLLAMFAYAMSVCVIVNGILPGTETDDFNAEVIQDWSNHGRTGSSHYIKLDSSLSKYSLDDIRLSTNCDAIRSGDSVRVNIYLGPLLIPYCTIKKIGE